MGPIAEKLLMWAVQMLIQKVLTPEHIKGLETDLIVFLKAIAAKSPNLIDDMVVDALAKALGVDV